MAGSPPLLEPGAPSSLLRMLFKGPTWLYRGHLGWLLGRRFLEVTHRGRRSGRVHHTVLEVIRHDRSTKESIVVSAYGTGADWYRNLQVQPALRVRTGFLDYLPRQRFLTTEERRAEAVRFLGDHRFEARLMPGVLRGIGAVPESAPADPAELAASLPMVAFRPAEQPAGSAAGP
ncbi:MAG: nitroreductase/quinone reductase family protein [Actinomycetota bacterium]